MKARARTSDHETAHMAAEAVEARGTAATQRALCLAEVRRRPGLTAAEVAAAVGLERHVPSRRLPELREAGFVMIGPARVCAVMGTRAMTWFPSSGRLFA